MNREELFKLSNDIFDLADEIENELFGDESGLKQQTINASGSGIIVPSNYKEH